MSDGNISAHLDERDDRGQAPRPQYDEVVDGIGLRKFHLILALVCGWANATDAVEVLCLSLVLTSAQCELNISSGQLGWLSAIVFLGMLLGGYLWGSLGDALGRKSILISTMFVNALFGFLSSFSHTFWQFILCRFLCGIGVGGSVPVVWSYFIEFQPSQTRGSMISILASFWMVGQLLTSAIGWAVIPSELSSHLGGFEFGSWRIFLVLSTFVGFSASLSFYFMPESPKYLLQKGKRAEAVRILKEVQNSSTKPGAEYKWEDIAVPDVKTNGIVGQSLLKRLFDQTVKLLRPPWLRFTVTMVIINFTLAFGYYGLTLWFPRLFTESRKRGVDGPICGPKDSVNSTTSNQTHTVDCSLSTIHNPVVFREAFILAISALPTNLLTIAFMDRIGRKIIFLAGIVLSAASVFLIYAVQKELHVLILSCVFNGVSILCWNCLDCFASELFPTHLRATAMGFGLIFARVGAILGNLIFGYFVDTACEVPLIVVACLLSFGGVVSFTLPDLSKKTIQ